MKLLYGTAMLYWLYIQVGLASIALLLFSIQQPTCLLSLLTAIMVLLLLLWWRLLCHRGLVGPAALAS
jgi:hypothetical protein